MTSDMFLVACAGAIIAKQWLDGKDNRERLDRLTELVEKVVEREKEPK